MMAQMMEEASTSETSVHFYQTTRRNNAEDSIFVLATMGTSNLTGSLPVKKIETSQRVIVSILMLLRLSYVLVS
jgi:hypothetical protein